LALSWLSADFAQPARLDLHSGHHLRPIRAADAEIDLPAVLGSRERLWARYGDAWGWPPETMSLDADRDDLAHHEAEMLAREGFNYAILDTDETELLGCVYIYPPGPDAEDGIGADVSWWVVDRAVGTELEGALGRTLPVWLAQTWGIRSWRAYP